ncbi:unnamed protein product [Arabidopsis arenosa]|uniref:Uncharacterized protein n=1 Tax=Arabidopsis arenosa TaxID=38785 RepID=A0A8S2A306_ARAAE|nr:unnamed protein product [Arabidopsis arenosa]
MAKTRGGGQVAARRSRRNQGLEVEDVAPATTLKVNKKVNKKKTANKVARRRSSTRAKKVAAVDDEVEDVTPKVAAVDDEVEDVTPEAVEEEKGNDKDITPEADQTEKAMPEDENEGEGCLTGQGQEEDEEEVANIEEEACLTGQDQQEYHQEEAATMEVAANNEEVANMEEDGVGNGQDKAIPTNTDEGSQVPEERVKVRRKRGPTKMRKVAENPNERVSVSFTDFGDHVGTGSVRLSSFLGVLVSQFIPVTISDWRQVDAATKETLWEQIQGRFDMEEEWKKAVIMKQMCNIFRGMKSRLVTKVRAAETAADILALKPSNIPSIQVWNSWVKSKTSKAFTEVSNKMRKLRHDQIPQTSSRKGLVRLADDMKKKSSNPSKVTRTKVWLAGHTHADGRPVKPQFAETIKQIQSLDSEMDSTSAADNIREDAVSQILGKDKPGRVRGFGRGITATKLAFMQARDAKMAEMKSEIDELKGMFRDLAGKKKSYCDTETCETETCESSGVFKVGDRVQLLDWIHSREVVVGEGEFCSDEQMYKIGRIPIGPNAVAVIVSSVLSSTASLWRPTSDVLYLKEAVGCKISWPMDKVLRVPFTSEDVSLGPNKEGETRSCKIFDWENIENDELIAEGIVCSSNSKERVNNIPLGPGAVSLQVVKVFNFNAPLWRPTADISVIGEAIHEKIAWPVLKIDVTAAATPEPTLTKSVSPGSNSSTKSPEQKCVLLDCNNSGRIVAEGRVMSTDPEDKCHNVPLGPNASKVSVDLIKIGNAKVWRPNSEFVFISDAVGSVVPWPSEKVKNTIEYSEGATNFAKSSARRLGNLSEMLCPCRDCRNLCHQSIEEIVEHLVLRGMDKKYKTSCWNFHGEKRADTEDNAPQHETEAFDLFKTAFSMGEALGTLSGCKVKGKQACNVCGKHTPSRWLKFSRKFVYMGNRKRLPPGHRYRYKKAWFDNTVEEGTANRIQTGSEIYETLQAFRNDFGKPLDKESKRKRTELDQDEVVEEEECEESNDIWRWKKRSIFFELPYWKDLLVRHNIDVMHVEKNVSDAILSILMQSAKSKDGLKARKDLEDIGIRNHLHTEVRGKKTYLPPAAYWLSKKEKTIFCQRLSKFRGPDGYCGNIANSVSVTPPNIGSLKSHDHHVLVQNLLPAALRGLLHKGPRIAINRLCSYFNRYMKTLKAFVKNHARPEACMAEGYLAGECVAFCLEFLKDSVPVQETVNRNEDIEADRSVVEGRPLQKGIEVTLSDKDRDNAHRYVLMNMASLDPYVEMHLEELQANDARCAKSETLLWKNHTEQFAQWLKKKIHSDSRNSHSKEIRWLAFGPRNVALAHKGFIVNGQRFHTDAVKRKTQNSGITYEAFSMCRSSARDMRQVANVLTYYGVIKEILLMDYDMFKVPLFRCNWANTGNGVKEEDGFTLVNLHMNQTAYLKDPFILPSQAKQVFYSREDDNSNWYVVMRAPPRGYHELETEKDLGGAPLPVQEVDDLDDEAFDDDSVYVRDDCEGLLVVD